MEIRLARCRHMPLVTGTGAYLSSSRARVLPSLHGWSATLSSVHVLAPTSRPRSPGGPAAPRTHRTPGPGDATLRSPMPICLLPSEDAP